MTTYTVPGVAPPPEGKALRVVAGGVDVAIFNRSGTLYGIAARCTHVGGPLDRGTVTDTSVTCPLHGSIFDLRTGAVLRGPAASPVAVYRVRAENGGLVIESSGG